MTAWVVGPWVSQMPCRLRRLAVSACRTREKERSYVELNLLVFNILLLSVIVSAEGARYLTGYSRSLTLGYIELIHRVIAFVAGSDHR